uniref:uncharacterized protein LOC122766622 isoform X3 n=1 Tax=Solea senegalensis TaxID=28829 RepID=UPI001CD8BAD2|nr:uncharacterized protein LOC122766622 isoform X3 [Solea senegalensis]
MALTMLGDKGAVSGAMAAKVKNAQVTSTMDAVMSGISSPDYCTIAATVVWVLTALARIIYELVFYRDTPQQLTILLCLLSPGLFTLLVIYVVNYLRENNGAESQKKPKRATATQVCLLGLIICTTVVTDRTCSCLHSAMQCGISTPLFSSCSEALRRHCVKRNCVQLSFDAWMEHNCTITDVGCVYL